MSDQNPRRLRPRWTVRPHIAVRLALVLVIAAGVALAAPMRGPVVQGQLSMSPGPDQCQLTQIAFCDTFQTIVGGGREGDLDPTKWSFTRITSDVSPFPLDTADTYNPAIAQFCKTTKPVQPDGDSFICGAQFGESNHWMETINDGGQYVLCNGAPCNPGSAGQEIKQGSYVVNSARIRQPFDFAGRTGTVDFSVDAHVDNSGMDPSHGFWPEVWLTDQPVQGPHLAHPGTQSYPRNGVGIIMDGCPGNQTFQPTNSIEKIVVFNNYVETELSPTTHDCFNAMPDDANHFQIKISQNNIAVFASDNGGMNFRQRASFPLSLNFSRGYLSFEHAHYNAEKYGSTNTSTYHWHAIGFDGPVLPLDRGYEVPDAMHVVTADDQNRGSSLSIGQVNLGYETGAVQCTVPGCSTPTFNLNHVDTSNVTQAYLTYDAWFQTAPTHMISSVNGVPYTFADPNPADTGLNSINWHPMVQPIPLSALHSGTNTVSFSDPGTTGLNPTVANIDLELVRSAGPPPTPTPTPPPTPTATPTPPTTPTPTVPPTATPTPTPPTGPIQITNKPCTVLLSGALQIGTCTGTFTRRGSNGSLLTAAHSQPTSGCDNSATLVVLSLLGGGLGAAAIRRRRQLARAVSL